MESCDEWPETCLPMVRTIVFMVPISRRVSPTGERTERESGVVSKAVSRRDSVLAKLIRQHFVIESPIRFCVQIRGRRKIKRKTETADSGNCALMVRLKPIISGFRFFFCRTRRFADSLVCVPASKFAKILALSVERPAVKHRIIAR